MEWLMQNWESAYNIWGVGILGIILFLITLKKYGKLKRTYHELIITLYDKAYDIAIKVISEQLGIERSEREHVRREWERRTDELIQELKQKNRE